ncbi:MAG: tetratricopeptide repeat protein [Bacillota bacterium]|nr:tetratricopeptide repeat protein [Bacillota bacterium]
MDEIFEEGNALYEKRDYKNAIKKYREISIDSEFYRAAVYNIGTCYVKLKQYDKALESLKSAYILKQDNKAAFNLGYAYLKTGDKKKALMYFNTAWALDNDDEDAEKAVKAMLREVKKIN